MRLGLTRSGWLAHRGYSYPDPLSGRPWPSGGGIWDDGVAWLSEQPEMRSIVLPEVDPRPITPYYELLRDAEEDGMDVEVNRKLVADAMYRLADRLERE